MPSSGGRPQCRAGPGHLFDGWTPHPPWADGHGPEEYEHAACPSERMRMLVQL